MRRSHAPAQRSRGSLGEPCADCKPPHRRSTRARVHDTPFWQDRLLRPSTRQGPGSLDPPLRRPASQPTTFDRTFDRMRQDHGRLARRHLNTPQTSEIYERADYCIIAGHSVLRTKNSSYAIDRFVSETCPDPNHRNDDSLRSRDYFQKISGIANSACVYIFKFRERNGGRTANRHYNDVERF